MNLADLGYHVELENYRRNNKLDIFMVGRVISEHKERYVVKTEAKEYDAEIIGNLRFSAQSRSDFPAVGDWVALSEYDDDKALIHVVFPRKTKIERQAVGKNGEVQIIATNIDTAFIMQALDRDFNINRMERYLTICYSTNVKPVIILNKTDLVSNAELTTTINAIKERISKVPVFAISNETHHGIAELIKIIEKGKTYCLLGSSGVGKSTLLNHLLGEQIMHTNTISNSTNKGRHVTTHRELRVLENGGILIDNPGMREIGVTNSSNGLEITFDLITEYAKKCKFGNCTHNTEKGCAVIAAVENGIINKAVYKNYLKIEREKEHFESTVAEKRKKDKDFGKMIKLYKKKKKSEKQ